MIVCRQSRHLLDRARPFWGADSFTSKQVQVSASPRTDKSKFSSVQVHHMYPPTFYKIPPRACAATLAMIGKQKRTQVAHDHIQQVEIRGRRPRFLLEVQMGEDVVCGVVVAVCVSVSTWLI